MSASAGGAAPAPEVENDRAGAPPPDPGDPVERILDAAREVGLDLIELLRLGLDRARLGARSGGFRLLAAVWIGLAVATATVVATYFLVYGLAAALSEAFGDRAWAGRLGAGLLVLGASALAIRALRGRSRRAEIARLEARYANRTTSSSAGEEPTDD